MQIVLDELRDNIFHQGVSMVPWRDSLGSKNREFQQTFDYSYFFIALPPTLKTLLSGFIIVSCSYSLGFRF